LILVGACDKNIGEVGDCECEKQFWLKSTPLRVRGYESEVMLVSFPVPCQPEVEQELIEVSLEGVRYFKIVCK
jgi:hypothetical protein